MAQAMCHQVLSDGCDRKSQPMLSDTSAFLQHPECWSAVRTCSNLSEPAETKPDRYTLPEVQKSKWRTRPSFGKTVTHAQSIKKSIFLPIGTCSLHRNGRACRRAICRWQSVGARNRQEGCGLHQRREKPDS